MGERTVDKNGETTIEESGMVFGAFPNNYFDALFDIEKSKIYQDMTADGVKSAEFLLRTRDKNHIWIVEAKSSSPKKLNLVNRKSKLDKYIEEDDTQYQHRGKKDFLIELYTKVKHDTYFDDIKSKFNDILALIASISLAQHSDNSELPEIFLFSKETHFNLVLVIKMSNDKDIEALQNLVQIKLNPLIKIWKLSANCVKVMNEQGAIKKGLISNNTPI